MLVVCKFGHAKIRAKKIISFSIDSRNDFSVHILMFYFGIIDILHHFLIIKL